MSIREMKNQAAPPEMDVTLHLSDLWRGVRKFWWISILSAILCGSLAFLWTRYRFVPLYQTSGTYSVLIQNETLTGVNGESAYSFSYNRATAERLSTVFQFVAKSSILQKKICDDLGVSQMPAALSVSFAEGSNLMTVSAYGPYPQQTYQVLHSFLRHYSDLTMYIIGSTQLVAITEPVIPSEAYNAQDWKATTLKGVLAGFSIGAAWIVLYAVLRQTIRTKADLRQELNQNCIGVLPRVTFKRHNRKMDTRILLSNPAVGGDFMESIRLLRDAVQNALRDKEKVILVTSTAPEEGKSVTVLNLAAILAKNGKKVLVLDADLRNSGIAALLHRTENPPSTEKAVSEAASLYRIRHHDLLKVDVLSFDTQAHHLRQIVQTDQLHQVLDELRPQYDLILIDTPPCGMISDTAIIAGAADAAVYIIRQDMVLTSRIRSGIDALLSTDIRLIGCVLNDASAGIGSYGRSYGYGSYRQSYGSSTHEKEARV